MTPLGTHWQSFKKAQSEGNCPKCPDSIPCQSEDVSEGSIGRKDPLSFSKVFQRKGTVANQCHGSIGKLSMVCLLCCRPEELCLTFSCANGLGPEADLIPDGNQVEVNSTNWQDYYKHMLAFKLHKSIQREVEAVKKGLQHFIDERTMKLLHR